MTETSQRTHERNPPVETLRGFVQCEYAHLLDELARYDGNLFRLTALWGALTTAAFFAGTQSPTELVLPIAPLLSLAVVQFLLANGYAYASRLRYVQRIEKRLQDEDPESAPCFYSEHDNKYMFRLSLRERFLLPFTGVILFVISLFLGAGVVAIWRSHRILAAHLPGWAVIGYYVLVVAAIAYCVASALWVWKKTGCKDGA
jgi:hypothetical protein